MEQSSLAPLSLKVVFERLLCEDSLVHDNELRNGNHYYVVYILPPIIIIIISTTTRIHMPPHSPSLTCTHTLYVHTIVHSPSHTHTHTQVEVEKQACLELKHLLVRERKVHKTGQVTSKPHPQDATPTISTDRKKVHHKIANQL